MTSKSQPRQRKHPAHQLCRCFEGSRLATFARPGLEAVEAVHKGTITGGAGVACGVPLDRAWKDVDDQSERWDYLFTTRGETKRGAGPLPKGSVKGIAVEVHHAAAAEVPKMIAKKQKAEAVLSDQAPAVSVQAWIWVASPPDGEVFILRQTPAARLLAAAGIEFPCARLVLP